jgi:hypothetical protein
MIFPAARAASTAILIRGSRIVFKEHQFIVIEGGNNKTNMKRMPGINAGKPRLHNIQ